MMHFKSNIAGSWGQGSGFASIVNGNARQLRRKAPPCRQRGRSELGLDSGLLAEFVGGDPIELFVAFDWNDLQALV